jgi:hypothetical protein
MSRSSRAQVLLEPDEYARLEEIAIRQGSSVSGLIRDAVRDRYFPPSDERQQIVAELLAMRVPLTEDWSELNALLEATRHADLP